MSPDTQLASVGFQILPGETTRAYACGGRRQEPTSSGSMRSVGGSAGQLAVARTRRHKRRPAGTVRNPTRNAHRAQRLAVCPITYSTCREDQFATSGAKISIELKSVGDRPQWTPRAPPPARCVPLRQLPLPHFASAALPPRRPDPSVETRDPPPPLPPSAPLAPPASLPYRL